MARLNPSEKYTERELVDHLFGKLHVVRIYSQGNHFRRWVWEDSPEYFASLKEDNLSPRAYAHGLHNIELTSDQEITSLNQMGRRERIFDGRIEGLAKILDQLKHTTQKPEAGQLTVHPSIILGRDGKTHIVYSLNMYTLDK